MTPDMSMFMDELVARSEGLIPRRRRRLMKQRTLKAYVHHSTEVSNKFVETKQKDVFLGASNVEDYITSEIQMTRNDRCISTEFIDLAVLASSNDWNKYIASLGLRVVKFNDRGGMLVEDETLSYFSYEISSASVNIKLVGDNTFVYKWSAKITDQYEEVKNVIEWVYSGDGRSIEVPLRGDRIPVDEMYPWLGKETLTEYYDRFMHSEASILLLIGPPGTGKTTFIRGLLQHTEESAIVTYDAAILSKDHLFADFIEGDRNVMVIEDADNFLGARTDGNDMMHKFLNVGDGLVTTKNKKLIFSTNLPSVKDIDPALIRPGRCFDIVNFAPLDNEQAIKLAKKIGISIDETKSQYTVADMFHKQVQAPKNRKRSMGFV